MPRRKGTAIYDEHGRFRRVSYPDRGKLARRIRSDKRDIAKGIIPLSSKTYGLKYSSSIAQDFDDAHEKLEEIRRTDPDLADALLHEAHARARVIRESGKVDGYVGNSSGRLTRVRGIPDALAPKYVKPRPGDIVREGSVGGRVLDGSIVVGSALLTVRLDEMIQARPLGLKPSTIKAILEALVLAIALLKRSRTVSRYAALSLTGTVGGKLVSAASRREAPAP